MSTNGIPTDFITSDEANEPDDDLTEVAVTIINMFNRKMQQATDHLDQLVFGLMVALQERDEPIVLDVEAMEMYQLFFDEYNTFLAVAVDTDDEGKVERITYVLETPEDDSDDSGAGA